jgi:hypothetical protein
MIISRGLEETGRRPLGVISVLRSIADETFNVVGEMKGAGHVVAPLTVLYVAEAGGWSCTFGARRGGACRDGLLGFCLDGVEDARSCGKGREGKGDHGGGGDWFVYNMKYLSLHARVLLFFVIVVACTRGLRDRTHRYRVYGCDDGRLVYIKVRLRYHGEGSASCAMPGCRRRLVAQWLVCMRL